MISELDKNILKIIILAERPISGLEISRACHISINTLRKEIDVINDFLTEHGCTIDIKIAIGYSLIIHNDAIAGPFLYRLLKDIHRFNYMNSSDRKVANYIIRRLLCADSPVSVETLMNELFYSKSTVLRNIESAKEELIKFDLEIKIKRNVGLYIEGSEWNKRICLIHQHKIKKHSSYAEDFDETPFNVTFLLNTDYPRQIRTIFLSNVATYSMLSYSHIDLPTIFNFLILCKTRHNLADQLVFSKEQLQVVNSSPVSRLADDLISNMPPYFQTDMGEHERNALAVLLAGLRKYNKLEWIEVTTQKALKNEVNKMLHFLSKQFYIGDLADTIFIDNFCCFLQELKNMQLFNIYTDREAQGVTNELGIFSSDLCAAIAHYIKINLGITLNNKASSWTYSILNRAVHDNQQFFNKQRFLVISRYSIYFAQNIATRIHRAFARNIEVIDVCEYTDIPNIDLYSYDAVITDIIKEAISIDLPIIEIDFQRSHHDFYPVKEYFSDIFKKNAAPLFTESDYTIASFADQEAVYHAIYESLDTHMISEAEWCEDCRSRDSLVSFERNKEIIMVTNLNFKSEKPIFKLFVNKDPFIWKYGYASTIIYYHYGSGSRKEIQLISYLIKQFMHRPEYFLNSLSHYSYEEIVRKFE